MGALAAGLAGCSGGEFEIVPVSGVVRIGGEPAAHVKVEFQPVGEDLTNPGPKSIGYSDDEGRYTVATVGESGRRGAVVGRHKVTVYGARWVGVLEEWSGDTTAEEDARNGLMPSGIAQLEKPTLEVPEKVMPVSYDVASGGTDAADFDL
ncbi:MAG: hypothetical protein AAGJ97_09965 [Planctomycetota bacterium]